MYTAKERHILPPSSASTNSPTSSSLGGGNSYHTHCELLQMTLDGDRFEENFKDGHYHNPSGSVCSGI